MFKSLEDNEEAMPLLGTTPAEFETFAEDAPTPTARRAGKAAVPVAPPPPPAIGKSILAPRTNRSVAASLPFNASMLQQGMAGLHRTGRDSQGSGRKGSARKRGRKSVGEWAAAVFSLKPPHCLAAT